MNSFSTINGHNMTSVCVHVANIGPWWADCDVEDDAVVTGAVTIKIGELELKGTVDPEQSGMFGLQRKVRVIAGANGWSKTVTPKNFHNDAGVKARTVAEDAARAVGEIIGGFVPAAEKIGKYYVRGATTAACVLEDVLGGLPWWVDASGRTQAGTRPSVTLSNTAYEVMAYNPRERIATLAIDDPRLIVIGSVISERLDGPQTIREFELTVSAEEMRVVAWCGGTDTSLGRLSGLFKSIVKRATDDKLYGKYKYRLVNMNDVRVELQVVSKSSNLPNILPVSMWLGIPGANPNLTPGTEVLVEFLEGDRTQPVVTHFAGPDGPGFAPVSLTIGGISGPPAARQGDNVEVLLPPMIFSGTIGGTPATGVVTSPLVKTLGIITAGSGKVNIAT